MADKRLAAYGVQSNGQRRGAADEALRRAEAARRAAQAAKKK